MNIVNLKKISRLALFQYFLSNKYVNRWLIYFVDVVLSIITSTCIMATYYLMLIQSDSTALYFVPLISCVVTIIALFTFKTYKGVVRYSTVKGQWRIILASMLKGVLMFVVIAIFTDPIYLKFVFVCSLLDVLATSFAWVLFRVVLINIYHVLTMHLTNNKKAILIYGTGSDSVMLLHSKTSVVWGDNKVVGYLSFNSGKSGYNISDHAVYQIESVDDLRMIVSRLGITAILFPTVSSLQKEKSRLVDFCNTLALPTLVVPEITTGLNAKVSRSIRKVKIEDLLGRHEININLKEVEDQLRGKVILVTGAAGSIGSEICRQLAMLPIKELVCFDIAETPTHDLRLELEDRYPNLLFHPIVGDVRNLARLDFIFDKFKPDVVFHAAAYKHVPLMEENPCEAVHVNVYGTKLVADLAVRYGVERFVMISTDKVINPTNVMGCSKRLAEIYVQSLDLSIKKGEVEGKTIFITTRFGNVLGSNGSVIPRFRKQIENGGPVTVTDPEITRYFMTIPEACRLVLEASIMGKGSEIFVFNMGEPVKIVDLARKMIELSGLEVDVDVKIEFTGLRPGEKLYEELLDAKESTMPTPHKKISVASVREYQYSEISTHIDVLTKLSSKVKVDDLVQLMKKIVPEFRSQNSIFEKFDK